MISNWWYQRMALLVLSLLLASCGGPGSSGDDSSSNTGRATAAPESVGENIPTQQRQLDAEPGSAAATPTVEPIERVLETTAQHTFRYAGMQYTLSKAVISNRQPGEPARYSADSATMELTLMVKNPNAGVAQVNDGLLHVSMGSGEVHEQPLRLLLQGRDSKEHTVSFEVPVTSTWGGAELMIDEVEREPVLLPLTGPISPAAYPVTLAAGGQASVKTPALTFSVIEAQSDLDGLESGHHARAHTGTRFVRLKIHVTSQDEVPAFVGPDSFRLLVDDVPKAPVWLDPAAEGVNPAGEKDFVATFVIPMGTKSIALQVGEPNKEVTTIPLTLNTLLP